MTNEEIFECLATEWVQMGDDSEAQEQFYTAMRGEPHAFQIYIGTLVLLSEEFVKKLAESLTLRLWRC